MSNPIFSLSGLDPDLRQILAIANDLCSFMPDGNVWDNTLLLGAMIRYCEIREWSVELKINKKKTPQGSIPRWPLFKATIDVITIGKSDNSLSYALAFAILEKHKKGEK